MRNNTINWRNVIREIFGDNLNKGLGQCFLYNYAIVENIVGKVELSNRILEIGPGCGILSHCILNKMATGGELILIEKDKRFINHLHEILDPIAKYRNIKLLIINDDALKHEEQSPIQIIANIPYNISSNLLYKLLKNNDIYQNWTLMLQKEVSEKLWQSPTINKNYSLLSAIAQCTGKLCKIMNLSPQSFVPAPSVYSQVINYRANGFSKEKNQKLCQILNEAFIKPNRKIINNLQDPAIKDRAISLEFHNLRPCQITAEQYVALLG